MRAMRVAAIVGLVCGLAGPALAQTKDFSRTVDLGPGGVLDVKGDKGNIHVTAWDQPQVDIKARIEAPEGVSADYARRAVEATTVDVEVRGSTVTVKSNYDKVPSNSGWVGNDKVVPYVHYEIRAPRKLELRVETDRGTTTVDGIDGRIDLNTDRGNVVLHGVGGKLLIDMDRGALDARDVKGDADITMDRGETSTIAGLRGSLRLDVDRSDLRVTGLAVERASHLEIDRGRLSISLDPAQPVSIRAEIEDRAGFNTAIPVQVGSSGTRVYRANVAGGGPELSISSDRAPVDLKLAGR